MENKKYGFWHFAMDMFLTFITGGLWAMWLVFKLIRSNIK